MRLQKRPAIKKIIDDGIGHRAVERGEVVAHDQWLQIDRIVLFLTFLSASRFTTQSHL